MRSVSGRSRVDKLAAAELAFPGGPQSRHYHLFLENTVEEEIAQREIVKEV